VLEHIKSRPARNYKAKALPIAAPVIAMTIEMNGNCSTGEAELEFVEEVEVVEDGVEVAREDVALVEFLVPVPVPVTKCWVSYLTNSRTKSQQGYAYR
jgi:hypothetical protein